MKAAGFRVVRRPDEEDMKAARRIPKLIYRFTDDKCQGLCDPNDIIAGTFVSVNPQTPSHDVESN